MNRQIVFTGMLFLMLKTTFAQDTAYHYPITIHERNEKELITKSAPYFEGEPFLHPEFRDGFIITTTSQPQKEKMRYNIYNDEIEVQESPSKLYSLMKTSSIKQVIIHRDTLLLDFYSENKKIKRGYLKLIVD